MHKTSWRARVSPSLPSMLARGIVVPGQAYSGFRDWAGGRHHCKFWRRYDNMFAYSWIAPPVDAHKNSIF